MEKEYFEQKNSLFKFLWIAIVISIFDVYLLTPIITMIKIYIPSNGNIINAMVLHKTFNMYQGFFNSFNVLAENKNILAIWFMCNMIVIIILGLILLFAQSGMLGTAVMSKNGPEIKPENGTHGTAKWMDRKEANEILDIRKGEIDGLIFGKFKNREFKLLDKAVTKCTSNYKKHSKEFLANLVKFQSLIEGCEKVALNRNYGDNKNVAVYGAPGTGKSRDFVRNQILQIARMGQSMVITDPKGELAEDMVSFLKDHGYYVKILNLVNLLHSDRWNPLKEVTDDISAQIFVKTIMDNTKSPGSKTDFWETAEMNLLKALILLVVTDFPEDQKTMASVYSLIAARDAGDVDQLFVKLDIRHPAKMPYSLYLQTSSENVRTSIIIGLGTRLQLFQNEIVQKLTSASDIDLLKPKYQKTAYFCIISDSQGTFEFFAGLFFSFLFIKLYEFADLLPKENQLEVYCILDEINNIGTIPDFTRKISTMRSRGIYSFVIFQNIPQLQNRYPQNAWSEILGGCDSKVFLGANDDITAKQVSEHLGITTVENTSLKRDRGLEKIADLGSINEGTARRSLMNSDEVLKLPDDKLILMIRGHQPLLLYKMDYSEHELSKHLKKVPIREYKLEWAKEYYPKEEEKLQKLKEMLELYKKQNNINDDLTENKISINDKINEIFTKMDKKIIDFIKYLKKSKKISLKSEDMNTSNKHKVFYKPSPCKNSSEDDPLDTKNTNDNNYSISYPEDIDTDSTFEDYTETQIDENDIIDDSILDETPDTGKSVTEKGSKKVEQLDILQLNNISKKGNLDDIFSNDISKAAIIIDADSSVKKEKETQSIGSQNIKSKSIDSPARRSHLKNENKKANKKNKAPEQINLFKNMNDSKSSDKEDNLW